MKSGIAREETTVLKAISILTVIITHANGMKAFVGVPVLFDSKITSILCQGGMCTFLILSGYGLYSSYVEHGFENWWDRKIIKLFIPAMIIQIIWFFIFSFYTYYKEGHITISWSTVIGDILCVNQVNGIDGSIWYLSYLLFCYVVFYFCFRLLSDRKAFPAFVLLWIGLMPIAKSCWRNSFYCISSFCIGVVWGRIASKYEIQMNRCVKIMGVIFSVAVNVYYYQIFRVSWLKDNVASNILAMGFILLFSMIDCKKLKVLSFFGENSFMLYLLQGKTICKFPYSDFKTGILRVILFLIVLALSIVMASIINYMIKHMSSIRQNYWKKNE